MRTGRARPALTAALVGVMAATIECGKLALSVLPNVEVVTILTALYSYAFGWLGVAAAVVFVLIEPLIYGFGSWFVSYLIYWPLVALVFLFLSTRGVRGRITVTAIAVILTVFFGVLTSLVDIGLFSGFFDNFLYRFGIYYARGIVFYAVQTACNAVLFFLLFPLLSEKLTLIRDRILR